MLSIRRMQRFISIILCDAFSIGKNNKFVRFLLVYISRRMLWTLFKNTKIRLMFFDKIFFAFYWLMHLEECHKDCLKIRRYVWCFLIKYSSSLYIVKTCDLSVIVSKNTLDTRKAFMTGKIIIVLLRLSFNILNAQRNSFVSSTFSFTNSKQCFEERSSRWNRRSNMIINICCDNICTWELGLIT